SSADLFGSDLSCRINVNSRAPYGPSDSQTCTRLSNADLRGTNLSYANLKGVRMDGAQFGCLGKSCTDMPSGDLLRGINLQNVRVYDATKMGAPPVGWELFDDNGITRLRSSDRTK